MHQRQLKLESIGASETRSRLPLRLVSIANISHFWNRIFFCSRALPKKLASLVDRSSCFRFPAARESLKCSRKGLRRYSATRTDQKPFFVILDKTQKKFPSMPVQRDREIVSKKLLFLSSPVEVEADESLARANRKSGLLNSLPVLLLPDADLEAKANHRALTLSK